MGNHEYNVSVMPDIVELVSTSTSSHKPIAKLHTKVASIRKDALHKLTTTIAKNHGRVVIEDLNVSGMLANHKLAKSDRR